METTNCLEIFDPEAVGQFREWYPAGFQSSEAECRRMAALYKSNGHRVRLVSSTINIVEL